MADAYSQTISGEVATTLGANSRKFKHDTFNYGTPAIYPIVIVRDTGDWDGYADSNSDLQKVLTVVQTRAEIYGIGEVDSELVAVFVNWNTMAADAGEEEPNYDDQLDYLEAEILAATSIVVRVDAGKIVGGTLENNC
jgi:hypothetical protein